MHIQSHFNVHLLTILFVNNTNIQFLEGQFETALNALQRLTLFIDIFIGFMEELVKFPKTKPKSLIPHQCFLTQSKFKDLCALFVQIFGDNNIEWHCDVSRVGVHIENGRKKYKYIKHKNRSQELFDAFQKCLSDVKSKWTINGNNDEFLAKYRKWSETIYKFKPTQYTLSFRKDMNQNQSAIPPSNTIENINNNNIMLSNQHRINRAR